MSLTVTRISSLTFYKSDLYIANWLPALVSVNNGLVSWAGRCRWWVRILFIYMVWPLSICIFSFSVDLILLFTDSPFEFSVVQEGLTLKVKKTWVIISILGVNPTLSLNFSVPQIFSSKNKEKSKFFSCRKYKRKTERQKEKQPQSRKN